ncbi:MAG TPA: hypothetical protein VHW47_00985, partial [Acidimicrobiales bacterium]|nr:hypothetical protein [Acidimicrobiales bacterium]
IRSAPSVIDRLFTWGSDLSGGFYFSHVLVLQLILTGLVHAGLRTAGPWWLTSIVLYPATLLGTAIVVTLVERTPLRFVLTGPNRTEERAFLGWFPRPAWLRGDGDGPARETAIGDPHAWAGSVRAPVVAAPATT